MKVYVKMTKKIIKFSENQKKKFHQHKIPISIDNTDIN